MDHHQTHAAKVPDEESIGEPVQDEVTNQQNLTAGKIEIIDLHVRVTIGYIT